ncbi:DUF5789 family protein [Halomarina oriensis]|uniref:DUF2795 domain-containing protein n=1 Tax=Halomarina oriensis TaxID=671145 RepID=A0A6B0GRA9_9EURY|nr:hypothetical protein [Halomarina oriensis]MWG35213.1 hypothetical protein [Halomarina oriensis]
MSRDVKLSRIQAVLAEVDYPTTRETAASAFDDVTLLLADGETNLGSVVRDVQTDEFESVDDLEAEVYGTLPRNAVGEPYQSEGDG